MSQDIQEAFAIFLRQNPQFAQQDSRDVKGEVDFHAQRIISTSFQEFPKMMYGPEGGKPRIAATAKQQASMEKIGWQDKPFPGHIVGNDGAFVAPPKEQTTKAN